MPLQDAKKHINMYAIINIHSDSHRQCEELTIGLFQSAVHSGITFSLTKYTS